jgi:hypothetical protein
MGTQGVHMKIIRSLVGLVVPVCTRDFCPALAALVGPVKKMSPSYTILIRLSPMPSKLRAGSRAGSPIG